MLKPNIDPCDRDEESATAEPIGGVEQHQGPITEPPARPLTLAHLQRELAKIPGAVIHINPRVLRMPRNS